MLCGNVLRAFAALGATEHKNQPQLVSVFATLLRLSNATMQHYLVSIGAHDTRLAWWRCWSL